MYNTKGKFSSRFRLQNFSFFFFKRMENETIVMRLIKLTYTEKAQVSFIYLLFIIHIILSIKANFFRLQIFFIILNPIHHFLPLC